MDAVLLILLCQIIPLFLFLFIKNNLSDKIQKNPENTILDEVQKTSSFFQTKKKLIFQSFKIICNKAKKSFFFKSIPNQEISKKNSSKRNIDFKNKQRINEFMAKRKIKQKILKINLKIIKKTKIYPLETIKEIANN